MPRVANGFALRPPRAARTVADVFEPRLRVKPAAMTVPVRVLSYQNHARMGTYADAIHLADQTHTTPDVTATRRPGTLKYGFGLNVEQELAKDVGVFGRLGWNDGKTESFVFTAIDRLASVGVSVGGARWKRPHDTAASALIVSGLSAVHAQYLARGGLDFLIGDGTLRYGPRDRLRKLLQRPRDARCLRHHRPARTATKPGLQPRRGPVWIWRPAPATWRWGR